jgi:aryl-alcohol dehydrogenase-like predicted oxidoreductase
MEYLRLGSTGLEVCRLEVARIASDRQVPRAPVALAWVTGRPGITAPIIGATKPHQTSATQSPRSTSS